MILARATSPLSRARLIGASIAAASALAAFAASKLAGGFSETQVDQPGEGLFWIATCMGAGLASLVGTVVARRDPRTRYRDLLQLVLMNVGVLAFVVALTDVALGSYGLASGFVDALGVMLFISIFTVLPSGLAGSAVACAWTWMRRRAADVPPPPSDMPPSDMPPPDAPLPAASGRFRRAIAWVGIVVVVGFLFVRGFGVILCGALFGSCWDEDVGRYASSSLSAASHAMFEGGPLSRYTAAYLQARSGDLGGLTFVEGDVASTRASVVSVRILDGAIWTAAARSSVDGDCCLMLARRPEPDALEIRHGRFYGDEPCVAEAVTEDAAPYLDWPGPYEDTGAPQEPGPSRDAGSSPER